jgi:hypothetical protein
MNPQAAPQVSYRALAENGLMLSEQEFNTIITEIKKGIREASEFLKVDEGSTPTLSFINETGIIGFSPNTNSINIRSAYLNLIAQAETDVMYKDQLICFVPDKFYMVFKYLEWLRLFGMENAIHYYQFHTSPMLKVKFPDSFPENFSPRTLLLSDLEIEARRTVDKILEGKEEPPPWKKLDEYLSSNFPEHYNKSVSELQTLPKPDLEISFEMENLLA